jgi:hypothetical protein
MAEDWLIRLSLDELEDLSAQRGRGRLAKRAAAPKRVAKAAAKSVAKSPAKSVAKAKGTHVVRGRVAAGTRGRRLRMEATTGRTVTTQHVDASGGIEISPTTTGTGRVVRRAISTRSLQARVADEIRELVCGKSRKYAANRRKLSDLVVHSTPAIVTYLATAVGPHVGLAAAVISPWVAQGLAVVVKMGKEVYCGSE